MTAAQKFECMLDLIECGLISSDEAKSLLDIPNLDDSQSTRLSADSYEVRAMAYLDWSQIYGGTTSYMERRRNELQNEADRIKASWNPDKQCMKCGDELHWIKLALVCKTHGYSGKGC